MSVIAPALRRGTTGSPNRKCCDIAVVILVSASHRSIRHDFLLRSGRGVYRAPIEAETSREDLVPIEPVAERNTW